MPSPRRSTSTSRGPSRTGRNRAGAGSGLGGAIFTQGGGVAVANSTITTNTAQGGNASGGQNGGGYGGGIFNLNGALTLTNVTIAGNVLAHGTGGTGSNFIFGGALYNASVSVGAATPTATVTVANSILADSTALEDVFNNRVSGSATIIATGPNIVSSAVQGSPGSTVSGIPFTTNSDPLLGALQDNGGPTRTMLPQPGSPALDAGDNAAWQAGTSVKRSRQT